MPRILSRSSRGVKVGAVIFHDEKTNTNGVTAPGVVADIADLDPVTFTVEAGAHYLVELDIPWITIVAGGTAEGRIADETGVSKRSKYTSQSGTANLLVRELITAPGTYTRRGRIGATAQNVTAVGGVTFPITLTVRRVR